VIRSFRGDDARHIFEGGRSRRFVNIQPVIERKLLLLDAARTLQDLASPPNNRLEALKGDRRGQHSIRVNDQYRLCFRWTRNGPEDVELVDYH
jgi:proteic killer suppression protein